MPEYDLPQEIVELVEARIWPRTEEEYAAQELNPKIDQELVQNIAPLFSVICFDLLPLQSIQELIDEGDDSWQVPSLNKVDFRKTIVIGDFGSGSDTVIALNYENNPEEPSVIRMDWYNEDNPNLHDRVRWVKISSSFLEFCKLLQIL